METLSIGQVARQAGVGVETMRFYERAGLLEEPPRRASGYRQYSEQVVKRISFIKRAQKLGFSLKDITEFLMLGVDEQACLEEVKLRIEVKRACVKQKVVELLCLRQALRCQWPCFAPEKDQEAAALCLTCLITRRSWLWLEIKRSEQHP